MEGHTCLPLLCFRFNSWTCCHIWVEFVVGSCSCSDPFSPYPWVLLPSQKLTFYVLPGNSGQEEPPCGSHLLNSHYYPINLRLCTLWMGYFTEQICMFVFLDSTSANPAKRWSRWCPRNSWKPNHSYKDRWWNLWRLGWFKFWSVKCKRYVKAGHSSTVLSARAWWRPSSGRATLPGLFNR